MPATRVRLGDLVRDEVTGFQGIASGVSTFLYGCARVGVMSRELKGGQPLSMQWFDEPQLKLIQRGAVNVDPVNLTEAEEAAQARHGATGGPMPSVPTRHVGG